ncbi:MAG: hypothetical protein Q4E45_10910 [Eubacteriales bacterium]|nr:hypothetical protein [Eubacteriales bacterium]
MTEKKLFLILQSALCVLLVIVLAASAVSIYREGKALRAEDPTASIYTPEKTAAKLSAIAPLFFGAIGMTAAGRVLAEGELPNWNRREREALAELFAKIREQLAAKAFPAVAELDEILWLILNH